MKNRIIFAVAVALAALGLVMAEMRKPEAPVSPAPFLFLLADTQREITRMPMAVTRISDEKEIEIGNHLARMYSARLRENAGNKETQAVEEYVRTVGARLAQHAHRKLPYQFHYVPDVNFINAFALPGGHVFIGEGLMALMNTEDALAGVLGHELEHIDHYHCAERVQIEMATRRIPLGGIVALPIEIFVLGYTKDQELEADREGARLAAAAGYSPLEVIAVFNEFDKLYRRVHDPARNPQEELSRVAIQTIEGYFRSHPLPAERIAAVQHEVGGSPTPMPRPLQFQHLFLRESAERAFAEGRYGAASTLATRALGAKTDDVPALRVLAEARFALLDFAAAREHHQKLLQLDPVAAGDVRQFAARLAAQVLQSNDCKKAKQLAEQAAALEPVFQESYVVLIKAQLCAGDYEAAWETTQKFERIAPAQQGELPAYARARAESMMQRHEYPAAERLAEYALRILPGSTDFLPLYAGAAFAAGDFAKAADAYLQLYQAPQVKDWVTPLRAAADAFAASGNARRGVAALDAQRAREKQQDRARDAALQAEIAGLRLFAGDEKEARKLAEYIRAGRWADIPLESLHRIAWWYYRAGKSPEGVELARQLVGTTPNSSEVILAVGWAEIESGQAGMAYDLFVRAAATVPRTAVWRTRGDGAQMGLALASWGVNQRERALGSFSSATQEHPEWLNASWVRALYPPHTVAMVTEIKAERDRREAVQKALGQQRR